MIHGIAQTDHGVDISDEKKGVKVQGSLVTQRMRY